MTKKQEWYLANRERLRARSAAWYAANKTSCQKRAKLNREKNREKLSAYIQRWRRENRELIRARGKEYYAKRRDRVSAEAKAWRKANRGKAMLKSIQSRCRRMSLDCDLDIAWIEKRLRGVCELSAIKFDTSILRGPRTPSIDRINPGKAYTKKNCRMVLWGINQALSNFGLETMLPIFKALVLEAS